MKTLSDTELRKIDAYFRATNYLSLGQLYLKDNPLLKEELKKKGFNIDKKKICLDYAIDCLGTHNVKIELHKKVIAEVKVTLKKQ